MIRSGAQMNAPSITFASTRDLVSTFSRFQMPRRVCISVWQGTEKSGPCSPEGCRVAPRDWTVAADARRSDQHDVAALEHVLAAVVDRDAVDLHVAQAAVDAAGEPGRRELRALGHERGDDRHRGLALEADVLAEPATELARAARAWPQSFFVEEERAVALGHLDRCRRDVARPREHALAVLGRGGAHAA